MLEIDPMMFVPCSVVYICLNHAIKITLLIVMTANPLTSDIPNHDDKVPGPFVTFLQCFTKHVLSEARSGTSQGFLRRQSLTSRRWLMRCK